MRDGADRSSGDTPASSHVGVVNVSNRTFSECELSVLSKGLGFACTPSKFDGLDFIASVETALRNVCSGDRAWARREVANLVKRYKLEGRNLTVEQNRALGDLRHYEDIKILPADKGAAVVVLDSKDYDDKLVALLSEGPYKAVSKDPGPRLRRSLYSVLRPVADSGRIDRKTLLRLCPTHFQCPYIFGVPKIHKPGIPLRPIISMVDSLFAPVGRFLADVLSPFGRGGDSFVGNSGEVVAKLRSIGDLSEGRLVSFDVTSLFTNVPVAESLMIIEGLLRNDDSLSERTILSVVELMSLLEFCLSNCYFLHKGSFYVQSDGVAMGGSVSVVVANIYMFHFEELALSSARRLGLLVPDHWLRFVDDVLTRFSGTDGQLQDFLRFLNSLRPSIQFTMEMEMEGKIPFLDILITKEAGGMSFSVYRKATHTDLYLRRDSCHPSSVFKGLVNTLGKRAVEVCSPSNLRSELDHLDGVFRSNGYGPSDLYPLRRGKVRRVSRSAISTDRVSGLNKRVSIPFYPSLSEKVARKLKSVGLSVALRPPMKLGARLVKKRDNQPVLFGIVYSINCGQCEWVYVGESGRSLDERVSEHKRSVKNCCTNSEVAKHCWENKHRMDWSSASILDRERGFGKRLFKEAWRTRERKAGNQVKCELDPVWNRVLGD